MGQKEYHVRLRRAERRELEDLTRKGTHKARVINRARILLLADERSTEGRRSDSQICRSLKVCPRMVAATREKFWRFGLEQALGEKPRSGHPRTLSGKGEALLTTIACSSPPEGRSRWTLRLMADRLVELREVPSISHETVRRVLKKTTSSRGKGSSGASGR